MKRIRRELQYQTKPMDYKHMKETLKFVIELYSDYWKNPPIAEIYMNQDSKYKNYIKGTKDNPDVISFEYALEEGQEYSLMIDRYNKSERETNVVDGKKSAHREVDML